MPAIHELYSPNNSRCERYVDSLPKKNEFLDRMFSGTYDTEFQFHFHYYLLVVLVASWCCIPGKATT